MTRKENVTFLITELAKLESQVKLVQDSTSEKIIKFIKECDLLFKFKSPDCPKRGICGRKVFLRKRIKQNINSEVATRGVY